MSVRKNMIGRAIIYSVIFICFYAVIIPHASAEVNVSWQSISYPMDAGKVGSPLSVKFTVTDTELDDNGIIDKINVLLSSSTGDTTTLTLKETMDNGIFSNKDLVLTNGIAEFQTSQKVKISVLDNCDSGTHGNCDPKLIETLTPENGIDVGSDTDVSGISISLSETGPNTGIFSRILKFSSLASNANTATLLVKPGDVISIVDGVTLVISNGLIIPSPGDVGSIPVELGGTVTANYKGESALTNIKTSPIGPGRGGGGLILPGVVPDFVSSGGSDFNEPPTLGMNLAGQKLLVRCGVNFDGNCFDITSGYHEEFKLYEMMSGQHTISITMYCNQGVQQCNYVGIGIMPYSEFNTNPTWWIEITKNLGGQWTKTIKDPQGFLGIVTITTQIVDEKFQVVSFTIEFKNKDTDPMKVGIQLRDSNNGVRNWYLNEGVKFTDSDAYPYVQSEFEPPLKVEALCLNENPNHRYSCAFEKVRQLTIKNAEYVLNKMLKNE